MEDDWRKIYFFQKKSFLITKIMICGEILKSNYSVIISSYLELAEEGVKAATKVVPVADVNKWAGEDEDDDIKVEKFL